MSIHPVRLAIVLAAVSIGCGGGNQGSTPDAPPAGVDAAPAIDAQPSIDAPAGAFACLGDPLPTTAPDPVTVAGTAKTLNGLSTSNADGVLVAAFPSGGSTAIDSATTPTDGTFSLSLATGAAPLDAYIKATKSGLLDYYLFPATPLTADVSDAPVLVLSQSSLGTVESLASVTPAGDPNSVGLVAVVVQDCDGSSVAGATISVKESNADVGDLRYVSGSIPSTTATATDSSGAAFVFNVPAGTATISATVGGMTLRTHSIPVSGGATHATIVVP